MINSMLLSVSWLSHAPDFPENVMFLWSSKWFVNVAFWTACGELPLAVAVIWGTVVSLLSAHHWFCKERVTQLIVTSPQHLLQEAHSHGCSDLYPLSIYLSFPCLIFFPYRPFYLHTLLFPLHLLSLPPTPPPTRHENGAPLGVPGLSPVRHILLWSAVSWAKHPTKLPVWERGYWRESKTSKS